MEWYAVGSSKRINEEIHKNIANQIAGENPRRNWRRKSRISFRKKFWKKYSKRINQRKNISESILNGIPGGTFNEIFEQIVIGISKGLPNELPKNFTSYLKKDCYKKLLKKHPMNFNEILEELQKINSKKILFAQLLFAERFPEGIAKQFPGNQQRNSPKYFRMTFKRNFLRNCKKSF